MVELISDKCHCHRSNRTSLNPLQPFHQGPVSLRSQRETASFYGLLSGMKQEDDVLVKALGEILSH